MLTIAECRAVLGSSAPESDADVEALRDMLAGLAETVLDTVEKEAAEERDKGKEV